LQASKEIILCESLIDALTFWCAGFRNVTASYGIEGSVSQFGLRRPGYKTPVGGLFLCGASTSAGHGIVGAMSGGLAAANAILGRNLMGRVLRRERIDWDAYRKDPLGRPA